jgi:hypothetical protein
MSANPEGITARHAYPGDSIELLIWRSGEDPIVRRLPDDQALRLAHQLIEFYMANRAQAWRTK